MTATFELSLYLAISIYISGYFNLSSSMSVSTSLSISITSLFPSPSVSHTQTLSLFPESHCLPQSRFVQESNLKSPSLSSITRRSVRSRSRETSFTARHSKPSGGPPSPPSPPRRAATDNCRWAWRWSCRGAAGPQLGIQSLLSTTLCAIAQGIVYRWYG
jgi:hypothetical protein